MLLGLILAAGCDAPQPPRDVLASDRVRPRRSGPARVDGRLLFEDTCGACHDPTGNGRPDRAPSLHGSPLVSAPPRVLVRIVLDGIRTEASPAAPTYVLPMPAWRVISDRDLAAIVSYVRTTFAQKDDGVSIEEVAAVRRATAGRARPWSREELRVLAPGS
jgi:mono/diheme cytochrome c family protein